MPLPERDPTVTRPLRQVMISVIYGGIYNLGTSQTSIQDRFGLLSLVAIGAGNLAIASTIRTFPKEKTIVVSERSKNVDAVGCRPCDASHVEHHVLRTCDATHVEHHARTECHGFAAHACKCR